MEVFWALGYEGATLEDLQAAMGGINPPSFYAAFGSKENLFLEAVELYRATVGDGPVQALAAQPTARAAIEAMLRAAADAFCGPDTPRGCLLVLGAMSCTRASKSVQDQLLEFRLRAPEVIERRLERGVLEGDLPAGLDLAGLASFYTTVLHGLAIRARDGASLNALMAAVDGAMAAWNELTAKPTAGSRDRYPR
jgi:AcrR family transcriptional regulator